jgi:hypothetical protein
MDGVNSVDDDALLIFECYSINIATCILASGAFLFETSRPMDYLSGSGVLARLFAVSRHFRQIAPAREWQSSRPFELWTNPFTGQLIPL